MKILRHKGRHLVVAKALSDDVETLEGDVEVEWVALDPTIDGISRRGRRPNYDKPVSASDLEMVDHNQVLASEDVQRSLSRILGVSEEDISDDSSTTTED